MLTGAGPARSRYVTRSEILGPSTLVVRGGSLAAGQRHPPLAEAEAVHERVNGARFTGRAASADRLGGGRSGPRNDRAAR